MYRFFIGLLTVSLLAGCSFRQVPEPDDLPVASSAVPGSNREGPDWDVSMQWIEPDPHSPVLLISDYRFALAPATAPTPSEPAKKVTFVLSSDTTDKADLYFKHQDEVVDEITTPTQGNPDTFVSGIDQPPAVRLDAKDNLDDLLPSEGSVEIATSKGNTSRRSAPTIRIVPMRNEDDHATTSGDANVLQELIGKINDGDILPMVVLFDFDQDQLRPDASDLLDTLPRNSVVDVIGFTCDLGDEDYNLDLSQRRAERITSYLEQRGVSVRFHEGRGECCPVSDDPTLNRRVEIDDAGN